MVLSIEFAVLLQAAHPAFPAAFPRACLLLLPSLLPVYLGRPFSRLFLSPFLFFSLPAAWPT